MVWQVTQAPLAKTWAPRWASDSGPPGAGVGLGEGGDAPLLAHPGVELPLRLGHQQIAHHGVLDPAELGALPAVGAGLEGGEGHLVQAPGDGVHLPPMWGTQKEWITSAEVSPA